jgi:hypothetical protein
MYYPNVDEEQSEFSLEFGKFKLNYSSERPSVDYAIRTIECENTQSKEKRDIYHCHFTNWPDFGEPEHTDSFLKFLNDCRKLNLFNLKMYGPPIVHCSAGVGRSGTFILVDSIVEMCKLYGIEQMPYTVSELLAEFRSQRMGLVQTPMQFRFAYKAIADAVNLLNKSSQEASESIKKEEIADEKKEENSSDEQNKTTKRANEGESESTSNKRLRTSSDSISDSNGSGNQNSSIEIKSTSQCTNFEDSKKESSSKASSSLSESNKIEPENQSSSSNLKPTSTSKNKSSKLSNVCSIF